MPRTVLVIQRSCQVVFRLFIPQEQQRYLLTLKTAPLAFAYYVPLVLLTFLSRRSGTRHLRLVFLPFTLAMIIVGTFWFGKPYHPRYFLLELLRGLSAFYCIALALDLTFAEDGRRKVGEVNITPIWFAKGTKSDVFTKNDATGRREHRNSGSFLPVWYKDTIEALSNMRGIEWIFGKAVYIPSQRGDLRRGTFLRTALFTVIKHLLVIDMIQAIFTNLPTTSSIHGGSIFYSHVPPVPRYTISTFLHLLVGITVITAVEMFYSFAILIGVGLCGQSPTSWPPVFDSPWASESLQELWAKRWHQLLRRTFIVLGGVPGKWVAGRTGMVLGAFIASGLYHEWGMYLVNRGMDWRVPLFFTFQGVGVLCEQAFCKITGRCVGGWPGRVWTWFFILVLGQACSDVWVGRGMANIVLIPQWLSPARRYLVPVVHSFNPF